MAWILLATFGQFISAIVAILDKYIVSDATAMPKPFLYAFYSCILTGGWAVIFALGYIPGLQDIGFPHLRNLQMPSLTVVALAFLAAYTFFMALVSMYSALRESEAVNVMPVIGAISALMSFGFSWLFLDSGFSLNLLWGVLVLALGTMMVAQGLPDWDATLHVFHSGLFFALHYVTMKGLFLETSFDDGFFWSRLAFVLFALSWLLVPMNLRKLKEQAKVTTRRTSILVVFTKILAGVSAFLILKATDMGDVAVVQALDGVKFVFILLITIFFAAWLPDSAAVHEPRPHEVMRRVLYVTLIMVGYFILFL
jgi:uncharacterized membrane protein